MNGPQHSFTQLQGLCTTQQGFAPASFCGPPAFEEASPKTVEQGLFGLPVWYHQPTSGIGVVWYVWKIL